MGGSVKEANVDHRRLAMPLGEAMFTQRAIRRFRPDLIPKADLQLILEAAVRAPNGANRQIARFLVVDEPSAIAEFGALYRRSWWAKREHDYGWRGPQDVPPDVTRYRSAMRFADEIAQAPCLVFALAVPPGIASDSEANRALSTVPAVQNLLLAARALGIGSVPTILHPPDVAEFRTMFGVPDEVSLVFCIPLGYPRGDFGPTTRRPTTETCFHGRWGQPVDWGDQDPGTPGPA